MGLRFSEGDKVIFGSAEYVIEAVDDDPGFEYDYALRWNEYGTCRWVSEAEVSLVPGSAETPFDISEAMKAVVLLDEIVNQNLRQGLTDSAQLIRNGALELVLIRLSTLPGEPGKLASAALRIGKSERN